MGRKKQGILESLEAEVISEAGEYVKETVKRKAIKIGEISILIILGFILISFGIANLLGNYFPILNNGLNYLFLGMIFLIASFTLKV